MSAVRALAHELTLRGASSRNSTSTLWAVSTSCLLASARRPRRPSSSCLNWAASARSPTDSGWPFMLRFLSLRSGGQVVVDLFEQVVRRDEHRGVFAVPALVSGLVDQHEAVPGRSACMPLPRVP